VGGNEEAGMELADIESLAKIIESFAKVIALAFAGFWTWLLFVKNRRTYPRAKVSHEVIFRQLEGKKDLLRLSLNIENTGEILLELKSVVAWVQQVLPLREIPGLDKKHQSEFEWPLADRPKELNLSGKDEIEPGEQDAWHFDFLIDKDVETVQLYSHVENFRKGRKKIGWAKVTIYDIDRKEQQMARKPESTLDKGKSIQQDPQQVRKTPPPPKVETLTPKRSHLETLQRDRKTTPPYTPKVEALPPAQVPPPSSKGDSEKK
jgi:hypothetical protein